MRSILIDSVVFDLDGTLWDTSATCAIGWNRALERLGIRFRPITEHDVRRVTGKPHEQCIREIFAGLPDAHLVALATETALGADRAQPASPSRGDVPFLYADYGFGLCPDPAQRFASFAALTGWLLARPAPATT